MKNKIKNITISLFLFATLMIIVITCTESIINTDKECDPAIELCASFTHTDCNEEVFVLEPGEYYYIFWFGRFYLYKYQGIVRDKYYFYDGGLGYYSSYEDLITLIELCDIKHKP